MRTDHLLLVLAGLVLGLGFAAFGMGNAVAEQAPAASGIPEHILVTVEGHKGANLPVITRDDVMVYEGHDRDQVTGWVPAQGDHAALELFILLDDESSGTMGTHLEEIRKFISAQPANTKIGVAYMQNGIARIAQDLTTDHALAAKALRLPLGVAGVNGSPYFSVSDLVKRWPASTARREVVMATDGIDRYWGAGNPDDPYLDAAIDDAVRAGIIVSAIYTPGAGHSGHSYWQTYWGQIYLSRMADETGGEAYYIGFTGPPVSFTPFLDDVANRLNHQYLLTFLAKPQKKSGWQKIRLTTEVPNADLVSAGKVWVEAGK